MRHRFIILCYTEKGEPSALLFLFSNTPSYYRKSNSFPYKNKNHTFLNNHKKEVKTLINYGTDKAEADEFIIKCNRITFICDKAYFSQCAVKSKKKYRNLSILTGASSFIFVILTIAALVTLFSSAGFRVPPEAAIPFLAAFGLSFSAENKQRPYVEKLIAADYILRKDSDYIIRKKDEHTYLMTTLRMSAQATHAAKTGHTVNFDSIYIPIRNDADGLLSFLNNSESKIALILRTGSRDIWFEVQKEPENK